MKLFTRSQTSTVQPLYIGNEWVILYLFLLGMWVLIHAGITVNLY